LVICVHDNDIDVTTNDIDVTTNDIDIITNDFDVTTDDTIFLDLIGVNSYYDYYY
jgi:hypothetical protein